MSVIKFSIFNLFIYSSTLIGQINPEKLTVSKKLVNKDGSETNSKIEIMEAKHSTYTFGFDLAKTDSIKYFHLFLGKDLNNMNKYGEWNVPFASEENDIPFTITGKNIVITPGFIPTVNEYFASVKIEYSNGKLSEVTSFKYPPKTGSKKTGSKITDVKKY